MQRPVQIWGVLGAVAVTLAAPVVAQASGFALREYSATGQGNSFAGATASAEDITFMAFNPAGLTRQAGEHFSANATYIAPRAHFSAKSSTTVLGGAIGGGNGGDDGAPDALAPAVFYARQLSPDWFAGASLTVPYGLVTDYDSGWTGRYHALKSDIRTYNFNPVVAYKVTPQLSVAGGVQIAYSRGVLSNAVDFGTINVALSLGIGGGTPAGSDGTAISEGDDLAVGYNFGLLYEIQPGTRVGAAYRSKLHNRLDGAASFNNDSYGNLVANATGGFHQTGIQAELNLPETLSAGVYHELSPRLAVMAEAAWTAWSRIENLTIQFDNASQSDDVITTKWKNTMFYAIGANYKATEKWTLRTGLAYDQSPSPDATRTPRVPDEDRFWISFGGRYQMTPNSALDVGYTHMFIDAAAIDLKTADSNNRVRGNLRGSVDLSADVLSVHYSLIF